MILFEFDTGHRVRLHNGHATIDGPTSAKMKKAVQRAVKRVGCAPSNGDPDHNAAQLLIAEHGGKILEFVPVSIPGRVY